MTQERTMATKIFAPETMPLVYSVYEYTTDDGIKRNYGIKYYRACHILTHKYMPLTPKNSKPLISYIKNFSKFKKKLGAAVVLSKHDDNEMIMAECFQNIVRTYWDVVMKHLIDDHDIVTCCNDLFELDVYGKKIRNQKYVTIQNKGILYSIRLNVTEKGYKTAGQNFYSMKVSKRYLERIQEQINNKRYYG